MTFQDSNAMDHSQNVLFWLPGRVVGPDVGPERKWYGPTLSIASAANAIGNSNLFDPPQKKKNRTVRLDHNLSTNTGMRFTTFFIVTDRSKYQYQCHLYCYQFICLLYRIGRIDSNRFSDVNQIEIIFGESECTN